jgi:hypothetical protein
MDTNYVSVFRHFRLSTVLRSAASDRFRTRGRRGSRTAGTVSRLVLCSATGMNDVTQSADTYDIPDDKS